MLNLLFGGNQIERLLLRVINKREETRKKAAVKFENLEVGEKVQTNKEYPRCCGSAPIRGIVVGKEIFSDQEELDEKYPYLYANTNPYVVYVQTRDGKIVKLNVVWIESVR